MINLYINSSIQTKKPSAKFCFNSSNFWKLCNFMCFFESEKFHLIEYVGSSKKKQIWKHCHGVYLKFSVNSVISFLGSTRVDKFPVNYGRSDYQFQFSYVFPHFWAKIWILFQKFVFGNILFFDHGKPCVDHGKPCLNSNHVKPCTMANHVYVKPWTMSKPCLCETMSFWKPCETMPMRNHVSMQPCQTMDHV